MTSKYKHLNDAKTAILAAIDADIKRTGVFTICTCDLDVFGWDKLEHEAMRWLERHEPGNLCVRGCPNHGTIEWTVVED
jgi:hypothetical protein